MKGLLAVVLAGITTCAAGDLKIKMIAGTVDANSANPSQQSTAEKCVEVQCVSVLDDPGVHAQTIYVHGAAQRVDFRGIVFGQGPSPFSVQPGLVFNPGHYRLILPHMAVITHCDTGQVIELDLDSHEYREFKQPKYPSEKSFQKDVERNRKDAQKRVRWSTVDTGETKDFWGFTARRQITTISETVLSARHEEVVDGWYIDLPQPGCAPEYLRQGQTVMVTFEGSVSTDILTSCDCLHFGGDWSSYPWYDYATYSTLFWAEGHFIPLGFREVTAIDYPTTGLMPGLLFVGFTPRGLAVDERITGEWKRPASQHEKPSEGKEMPLETKITELSDAPLDPALFEIPPGFKKVRHLYQHSQLLQKVK